MSTGRPADESPPPDRERPPVLARLLQRLDAGGVPYRIIEHAPVSTSEQAAAVRGTELASGAKALVCKGQPEFVHVVMPADRQLDGVALRRSQRWRRIRFASADELLELTGLTPGAVPPFGSLFGLRTLCDRALAEQPTIHFNAGDHATSLAMAFEDWLAFEQPELGEFTRPPKRGDPS